MYLFLTPQFVRKRMPPPRLVPAPFRNQAHVRFAREARARRQAQDVVKKELNDTLFKLSILLTFFFAIVLPLHVLVIIYTMG